jgi:Fe-S-cluster containining protein
VSEPNPCLGCGVCCTHFRVSFYWAEADDAPGGQVPAAMTEHLQQHLRCMKGTNQTPRRCAALLGEVGVGVRCTIYEQRPSPCREFPVFHADGSPNEACQRLRAGIGLPPLAPMAPNRPLNPAPDLPRAA